MIRLSRRCTSSLLLSFDRSSSPCALLAFAFTFVPSMARRRGPIAHRGANAIELVEVEQPEVASGPKCRKVARCQHTIGDIFLDLSCNLPRRERTGRVRIDQHRQHHRGSKAGCDDRPRGQGALRASALTASPKNRWILRGLSNTVARKFTFLACPPCSGDHMIVHDLSGSVPNPALSRDSSHLIRPSVELRQKEISCLRCV